MTDTAPPLSRMQLLVLARIASGDDTAAIARHLWVSENTVCTHAKALRHKLGARNRAHAVAIAFDLGIFTARTKTLPVRRTSGRPAAPAAPRREGLVAP